MKNKMSETMVQALIVCKPLMNVMENSSLAIEIMTQKHKAVEALIFILSRSSSIVFFKTPL
jgi:hypothetical protein